MRVVQIIKQVWHFQCLACEEMWQDAYEAWHTDDGHGGDTVAWRHGGVAAMPPWTDQSCPSCLSPQVKPLPPATRPGIRPIDEVIAQRKKPN